MLSPDDFHSDVTLDIAELVNEVLQNEQRDSYLGRGKDGEEKAKMFVLETVSKPGRKANNTPAKIMVSIDCLTEQEATNSPVGIGRGDPN